MTANRVDERRAHLEHALAEQSEPTYLNTLLDDAFVPRMPIAVTVERHETTVGAYWTEVALFGEGRTVAEALNELRREIVEAFMDFRELEADGRELAGPAARTWRILQSCIEAHDAAAR